LASDVASDVATKLSCISANGVPLFSMSKCEPSRLSNTIKIEGDFMQSFRDGVSRLPKYARDFGKSLPAHSQGLRENSMATPCRQTFPSNDPIRLADNPGRQAVGNGEIYFPFLLDQLDRTAHAGWASGEYHPVTIGAAGLICFETWLNPWLKLGFKQLR
jgi:hydroxypyruvate isomerase